MIFFQVETILFFDQTLVQMPCGNIDADFVQLLEQQRLGDMAMVVLVQDKPDQGRTEVAVLQICRQLARYVTAVGCFIYLEPVADIVRLHSEILDHPIFIGSESRTGRQVFRFNGLGLVDFKFGGFMPFGRACSFGLGRFVFFGSFFFQTTGLYFGPLRLIFQSCNFVFE